MVEFFCDKISGDAKPPRILCPIKNPKENGDPYSVRIYLLILASVLAG